MNKIPIRHITPFVKEPRISEGFSIRDLEALVAKNDMVQELHRHDFFHVLAIEKGKGEHSIDFTSYPVSDHTVFFMRPGQVHQLRLKKGSTGYVMQFNTDFYSPRGKPAAQVLRKVSSKNHCTINAARFSKLLAVLKNIFEEYSGKQEKYKEAIKASLEIFFIELARQSRDPNHISNNSNNYAQERLEELSSLLEKNIATTKQAAQYAAMMHLSPYQLNAITKATVDKTCSELINEQIILEAKRNLLATSGQVNQIADDLGYEDVSYFIRFFKKHTGYSPEAFRHKFK